MERDFNTLVSGINTLIRLIEDLLARRRLYRSIYCYPMLQGTAFLRHNIINGRHFNAHNVRLLSQERIALETSSRQLAMRRQIRLRRRMERKAKRCELARKAHKFFAKKRYGVASIYYNEAMFKFKRNSKLFINSALCYMKRKFYGQAIQNCKSALRLNKKSLKAWLYLAKCYYRSGKPKMSEKCLKAAATLNPDEGSLIKDYQTFFREKAPLKTVNYLRNL